MGLNYVCTCLCGLRRERKRQMKGKEGGGGEGVKKVVVKLDMRLTLFNGERELVQRLVSE